MLAYSRNPPIHIVSFANRLLYQYYVMYCNYWGYMLQIWHKYCIIRLHMHVCDQILTSVCKFTITCASQIKYCVLWLQYIKKNMLVMLHNFFLYIEHHQWMIIYPSNHESQINCNNQKMHVCTFKKNSCCMLIKTVLNKIHKLDTVGMHT